MAEPSEALTIRYVDPRSLQPAERNPRIMPAHEMTALKAALDRWGFVDPIVLRKEDQRIIGGHQRVTAAIELGMELIPVVEADVSAVEAMILNEALNRIHGSWDEASLALHQQEIRLGGGDLNLTGFTLREIRLLGEEKPGSEPGDGSLLELVDVTIEEPRHEVQRGDQWRIGDKHILVCVPVTTGWAQWIGYLKDDAVFCPFAGPFIAVSEKADELPLVVVQPEPYIAAHILDRWADLRGEESLVKI